MPQPATPGGLSAETCSVKRACPPVSVQQLGYPRTRSRNKEGCACARAIATSPVADLADCDDEDALAAGDAQASDAQVIQVLAAQLRGADVPPPGLQKVCRSAVLQDLCKAGNVLGATRSRCCVGYVCGSSPVCSWSARLRGRPFRAAL